MDPNSILIRLMVLLGAKSQAELARILGLSPQALTDRKRRGSLPCESICRLAEQEGLSLDYIFFGKEPQRGPEIDIHILEWIDWNLANAIENAGIELDPLVSTIPTTAQIYNRVIKDLEPGQDFTARAQEEIEFAVALLKSREAASRRMEGVAEKHQERISDQEKKAGMKIARKQQAAAHRMEGIAKKHQEKMTAEAKKAGKKIARKKTPKDPSSPDGE